MRLVPVGSRGWTLVVDMTSKTEDDGSSKD